VKVVIVDDSKAMRMIVVRTLGASGLTLGETREAADGIEALAVIEEFHPDLVLSNWSMPNMGGLDLLNALRAKGDQVTLGFVTSESSPAMREAAIAAGASFLLVKPFNAGQFAEVISAAVN
jgi:two-component system, chemotaxis family, chemotaxis protein CheY